MGLAVGALLTAGIGVQTVASGQQVGPAPGETLSESYRGSQRNNEEYQKREPIKVFDNLYYVGPGYVSVWLIQTSDGLILIDGAQEPYVDHVMGNIQKLGFDLEDIEYILISHGHLDHFGGVARIQAASGARVVALEGDWQSIEEVASREPNPNRPMPDVVERDIVLNGGTELTLGDTTLKIYHLPGHTAGSPSFEFTVYDGLTPHKAFFFGGPGARGDGLEFLETMNWIVRNTQDVEVGVHVHSYLRSYPDPRGGTVFEPALELARRGPTDPHSFVDNAGWRAWIQQAHTGAVKHVEDYRAQATESQ